MIIEVIQEAASALQANPGFANIGVVSEDLGNPANLIDKYIATRGIGTILMTPRGNVKFPNIQGPYFDDIQFIVGVFENVKINRGNGGTGIPALTVVEMVLGTLHQHKPQNISEVLIAAAPAFVLVPHREQLVYNVLFKTEGGVSYPITTIAPIVPTVVDNGNGTSTISLACATPWAYIFFTTDGTYPAPRDGSGAARAPYSAPFTVTRPATVLARAWLPGYLASPLLNIKL